MGQVNAIKRLFSECLPLLSALGDNTRQRLILLMIEGHPKTVKELAETLQLSRPAVSHHIKVLKAAKVLNEQRIGSKRYYLPDIAQHMQPIKDLIDAIDTLKTRRAGGGNHDAISS